MSHGKNGSFGLGVRFVNKFVFYSCLLYRGITTETSLFLS